MVYFFSNGSNIKIGYTKNKIEKRLQQLNTGSDNKLICLGYIQGDMQTEKFLHKKFDHFRIRQNGEWFYPSNEIIEYINTNSIQPNTYVDYDTENKIINSYFCIKA